jgi:superoxide reductase
MTRRKFMLASGVMAGIAAVAPRVLGAEKPEKQGGTKLSRFGDVVVPQEHEGKEKHVPYIQAPAKVKAGEPFMVTVIVGKDVPHPNLIEHHIKWIQVYAKEEGERPVVHVGTFDLGPTYAQPNVTVPVILKKSSTLYAIEYCNIHGVWDNSVKVVVE